MYMGIAVLLTPKMTQQVEATPPPHPHFPPPLPPTHRQGRQRMIYIGAAKLNGGGRGRGVRCERQILLEMKIFHDMCNYSYN